MTRAVPRSTLALATRALAAAAVLAAAASPASADDDARAILKSMSDYLASQNNLSARFDVDLDVITPEIERISYSASGELALARPDKLHVQRTGGYSDVELVFDGKTATVFDRFHKTYSQVPAPGSVDQLIDLLRTKYMFEMPGADLLLTRSYDELMSGVIEAKHIGEGVINGEECEHLAFRNVDTDWQLWVRKGAQPLPCKYVITSKMVAGGPQYAVTLHDWKTGAAPATAFSFNAPAGAKSVALDAMSSIGELPAPAQAGAKP
ncbi:DUF2092 domain-containing protein [Caulobacter sp. 17J80-11]|uniref:DUF2092 domain-containing protein n=1 Tax=Caulobacter sp. 17J80-11 TaxID=2763502 RepID=UPI0016538A0C|nr:DUF2092 domain-containing protein [Caulobacter sp. 17J80-11]MBC6982344.1 DUF2092 domain-containing protein [Caulobacter sp. 17J80-11]